MNGCFVVNELQENLLCYTHTLDSNGSSNVQAFKAVTCNPSLTPLVVCHREGRVGSRWKPHKSGAFGSIAFCCGDRGWIVRPSFRLSGLWQLASKLHWVVFDNGRKEGLGLSSPAQREQQGWQPIPCH